MRSDPQQEFKGPVKSDVRHLGHAARRIDRQLGRTEAREPEGARRDRSLKHGLGTLRQFARKDRGLRLAVEDVVTHPLARLRDAGDGAQGLPTLADRRLSCSADGSQRHSADPSAGSLGAARGAVHEEAQDRIEPVVIRVMDVVGLGRGEEDPIGAGRKQAGEQRVASDPEGHKHVIECVLQLGQCRRPRIDGGQHVHQHDLAVDSLEMVAEEGPNHVSFIGLEAPLHQGCEAARSNRLALRQIERCEGECRRTCKITRHEKAPRRGRRHSLGSGPQSREVILEGFARFRCEHLV